MSEYGGRPRKIAQESDQDTDQALGRDGVDRAPEAPGAPIELARLRPRPGQASETRVAPLFAEAARDAAAAPPKWAGKARAGLKALVGLVAVLAATAALAQYVVVGRFICSTDDAYVRTDLAIVSPKISGYVDKVEVVENQHVSAGQVLARIDAGDYLLAVAAARQKAQTQDATIVRIKAQTDAQEAAVAHAEALVDSARAEKTRAESELMRVRSLAAADFASRQRYDQAIADRDKAVAALAGSEALLAGAKANLVVLKSQTVEAQRVRAELETALAKAERDLSFTEIRAPFDGAIGNRAVEPGQFVQPGARLMAIAPDHHYYVEANFKETQLDRLFPGEKAKVFVDAFGGAALDGEVESIAPASGSEFSLLPPENATGNFTKITQRFPVRIRFSPQDGARLRAGMSVVVDVDTRTAPAHGK